MHSMIRFTVPAAFAAILIFPLAAQADEAYPRTINQRQANQQQRVFNGVKSGQISQQEYRNLERRSLSVELQQRRDMRDGGAYTPQERYQLNQRLNRISDSIYRDRRN
jgi:hypothetical protein